jgi:hypothetical protein
MANSTGESNGTDQLSDNVIDGIINAGANEIYHISNIPDLTSNENSRLSIENRILIQKYSVANWIGLFLVGCFILIQLSIAFSALRLFWLNPCSNSLITYLNSVRDQWGIILGFILGYYFATRNNTNSDT